MTRERKIGFFKHYCHDFLKVSKGAVSILLMVVTTPFLALTLFLIESVRYQDTLELVFEMEDLAAGSTLGHYDTFIHDRFGLLSVDQSQEVSDRYKGYLNDNVSLYGNELQFDDVSVKGQFPLSETKVFEQQVLEYCEISSLVTILAEIADFDQLFEKLNGLIDTSKIEDITDKAEKLTGVLTAFKKLYYDIMGNTDTSEGDEAKPSLQELYDKVFTTDKEDVNKKYKTWKEKYVAYCNALKTATENAKEGEDPNEDSAVKTAKSNFDDACKNYKSSIQTMQTDFGTFTDRLKEIVTDISSVKGLLEKEDAKEVEKFTNMLNEFLETTKKVANNEYIANEASGTESTFETVLGDFDTFFGTSFKKDVYDEKDISSAYDLGSKITKCLDDAVDALKSGVKSIETLLQSDKDSSSLGKYLKIFTTLKELTMFYNNDLNNNISWDDMPIDVSPSFFGMFFIKAISDFVSACEDTVTALATFNLIKLIIAGIKFIVSLGEFIISTVAFIGDVAKKIGDICERASEYTGAGGFGVGALNAIYEDLLITGYATYNFSNRTNFKETGNYKGKSPLTGAEYTWSGNKNCGQSLSGGFKALKDISTYDVPTDPGVTRFKACELEYILCGMGSEIQNQLLSFIYVYLMRMALDLPGIFKDDLIRSAADAYPPFTLAIYLIVIIVEPFLDCFILVNGGQVPLVKGTIYLSPKGIVQFVIDLEQATSALSTTAEAAAGTKKKDFDKALDDLLKDQESSGGFEDFPIKQTYTECLLLNLLLMVDSTTKVKRMQNLVWMEARTKYLEDSKTFELEKAYTYVRADVDFTMKPMLNVGFSDNGFIKAGNTRYLGY